MQYPALIALSAMAFPRQSARIHGGGSAAILGLELPKALDQHWTADKTEWITGDLRYGRLGFVRPFAAQDVVVRVWSRLSEALQGGSLCRIGRVPQSAV